MECELGAYRTLTVQPTQRGRSSRRRPLSLSILEQSAPKTRHSYQVSHTPLTHWQAQRGRGLSHRLIPRSIWGWYVLARTLPPRTAPTSRRRRAPRSLLSHSSRGQSVPVLHVLTQKWHLILTRRSARTGYWCRIRRLSPASQRQSASGVRQGASVMLQYQSRTLARLVAHKERMIRNLCRRRPRVQKRAALH